jgi:hypothetical protein
MTMQRPATAQAQPSVSATAPSEVRGLVDNASEDRLYGWVFDAARPGARLEVELRLGAERLARTTADLPRPDLAQNGIGDGCHAFEFAVTAEEMAHARDFAVVALAPGGQEVALPLRVRQLPQAALRPAAAEEPGSSKAQLVETRRVRELVGSLTQRLASLPEAASIQALLGQNASVAEQVRAATQALDQRLALLPDGELLRQVAQQQEALASRLLALEVWMDRLDRRLATTAEPAAAAPPPARINLWQTVLFSALGLTLIGAIAAGLLLR